MVTDEMGMEGMPKTVSVGNIAERKWAGSRSQKV